MAEDGHQQTARPPEQPGEIEAESEHLGDAGQRIAGVQRRPQPRALFPPVAKIGCVRLRDLPPEGLKQLRTIECCLPLKRRIDGLYDAQRTELRFDDKGL